MNKVGTFDWSTWVFRCSELGNITSLGRGAILTEKQAEELAELLAKVKLTEKQAIRRDELIAKRDAPPMLSEGAMTYLKKRWIEIITGRVKYIETKYTEKGTLMEYEGILLANRVLGWNLPTEYLDSLEFSKQRVTNDYVTGEMDLNHPEVLADVKCPWDIHTFPFFEPVSKVPNTDYFWQLQGYMMLTGHEQAELVYTLVDTPDHLINDEIRRREWKKGYIEMPQEEQDEIRFQMTYSDLYEEVRVKRWIVSRDEEAISRIKESVALARAYMMSLDIAFLSKLKTQNV